ncbi:MAG: isocitrate/isopropylmalate family dehydrogenase, partial [Oceanospirillaceae bacterium]|nr:isocitrate/isopropylmalate family dehydrogenase [Oceanospirillaceae bacterium]
MKKVLVLPGDNIGPEIIAEAVKVLETVSVKFDLGIELDYAHLGGAAIDAVGVPCPQETLDKARASDAILLGAVGGPQWDDVERHL